jgi:hypothetical protein
MITDNDIKKLKTTFVTKDDLEQFATKTDLDLKVVGLVHTTELNQKLDDMENRLDKKYDKVMNVLDKVVGELQNIRDDMTMIQGNKDQLEDHEDRITTIETKLAISQ